MSSSSAWKNVSMLDLLKELRALGASEITLSESGHVTNVKFGHAVMLPPASPEAERLARVTMKKPDDERLSWYRAVAGVSE